MRSRVPNTTEVNSCFNSLRKSTTSNECLGVQHFTIIISSQIKWASTQENLSSGICKQQRRRPAFATGQTDQHLCFLLIGRNHLSTCYKRNFNFLPYLGGLEHWFGYVLVGNPEYCFLATRPRYNTKLLHLPLSFTYCIRHHLVIRFR